MLRRLGLEAFRRQRPVPQRSFTAGSRAFLPSELPAVSDLFSDFAHGGTLDKSGLAKLLKAVGEMPDQAMLDDLFAAADTDGSGLLDIAEFLAASDSILAKNPQVLARCTLVVGGPGSGKGMLCARLVAECGMGHVSCGDMLRDEVQLDTPLGQEVASILARGDLVSSATITALLRRRLRGVGGRRLLLDGFPRSRENAIDFEAQCGRPELALHLVCPPEVMIERILKRAQIEGRADDNLETARRRVEVFQESGRPTMQWLREARVPIIELDCAGTPDEVWSQLLTVGRLMRPAISSASSELQLAVKHRLHSALRQVPDFAAIDDAELSALQPAFVEERFAKGEHVLQQGDDGDCFYVIMGGAAEVRRSDGAAGGRPAVLAQLTPGSCFGERALLRSEPRFASIVAVSAEGLTVMRASRTDFEAALGPLRARLPDRYE